MQVSRAQGRYILFCMCLFSLQKPEAYYKSKVK